MRDLRAITHITSSLSLSSTSVAVSMAFRTYAGIGSAAKEARCPASIFLLL